MEAPAPRVPGGTWDVPTFTGDGKGPSLNTWLNAIALAHEMNGLTTGQTLKLVKARVDGLATAILEGIPSTANFRTIDELINGIRGLFTDGSDALSKLRDLWQQGQKQDELLELFARRVGKVVHDAMGPGNEAIGTQIFVSGIRDTETKLHVDLKEPANIEAALREAVKFRGAIKRTYNGNRSRNGQLGQRQVEEDEPMEIDQINFRRNQGSSNFRSERRQNGNFGSDSRNLRVSNSANNANSKNCLYCGQPGHFGNNCPELARHQNLWKKYEAALQRIRDQRRRNNQARNRGGFRRPNMNSPFRRIPNGRVQELFNLGERMQTFDDEGAFEDEEAMEQIADIEDEEEPEEEVQPSNEDTENKDFQ